MKLRSISGLMLAAGLLLVLVYLLAGALVLGSSVIGSLRKVSARPALEPAKVATLTSAAAGAPATRR